MLYEGNIRELHKLTKTQRTLITGHIEQMQKFVRTRPEGVDPAFGFVELIVLQSIERQSAGLLEHRLCYHAPEYIWHLICQADVDKRAAWEELSPDQKKILRRHRKSISKIHARRANAFTKLAKDYPWFTNRTSADDKKAAKNQDPEFAACKEALSACYIAFAVERAEAGIPEHGFWKSIYIGAQEMLEALLYPLDVIYGVGIHQNQDPSGVCGEGQNVHGTEVVVDSLTHLVVS